MARPPEPRINDRIRAREVRVIGPEGEKYGVTPLPQALTLARDLDLDLVEVAEEARPPVCKIMDYGKHKYETEQRAKEARKKASNVVVKEMKYRPKISSGDFETKTRKVEKFLANGNKVKVTIMFRGREVTHPELGRKILDDIIERVDDYAQVEAYPRLDGRNMTMVVGPDTKKKKKQQQRQAQKATAPKASEPKAEATPKEAVPASAEVAQPAKVEEAQVAANTEVETPAAEAAQAAE